MRRTIMIDCAHVEDEGQFWERYLDAIKPEGYRFGKNLNAFWDAVDGGGPGWPGEVNLHFINTSALAGIHQGNFLRALKKIGAECKATRIELS